MSGGLTAAGLLVLLLAFIGLGVGIYYAYVCLQARPLRPKPPTDSEHGPLITPDPDVNGNHEDAPLEASAPVDEEGDTKNKLHLDEPDISNGHIKSPTSDFPDKESTGTPKEKNDALVPIEDEIPPAKIMHERETAPVLNHVAPLGFVAPVAIVPQEISRDKHPHQNIRPVQGQPESQSRPPAPVYVPVPLVKKPVTLSDEEDGLLLQECPPNDDSLDPEHCPELTNHVSEHCPKLTDNDEEHYPKLTNHDEERCPKLTNQDEEHCPKLTNQDEEHCPKLTNQDEEHCPKITNHDGHHPKLTSSFPQENAPSSPQNVESSASNNALKENYPQSGPAHVPVHVAVTAPTPEPVLPTVELENPQSAASWESTQPVTESQPAEQKVTVAPKQAEQKVTVAPQPAEQKVKVAPQPADNYGQKEDITPVGKAAETLPQELPVTAPSPQLMKEDVEQLQPATKDSLPAHEMKSDEPLETVSDENIPQSELVNSLAQDISPKEPPIESEESSEILAHPVAGYDNDTEAGAVEPHEIDKETSNIVPKEIVEYPPVVYLETSQPPENSRAHSESSVSSEEPVPPYTDVSESNQSEEVNPESQPQVIDNSEQITIVDAPLQVSNDRATEVCNAPLQATMNTPTEPQSHGHTEESDVPHESLADIPLEASSDDIPIDVCDIPLDAYIPDSDDQYDLDPVDGEGSPLPVIKEEGSVDTETESTGTDSSEPEVTEYSFASGPSAPSTSVVLADEVSCTLEPEVTKYSVISEAEVPHSLDHQESESCDDDDDDDDSEVNPSLLPETSMKDDTANEEKMTKPSSSESSEDEPDSSSSHPVANTPSNSSKLDEPASSVPAVVATCDDVCFQAPDSTNTLSKQESSSNDSETESEGTEAEAELREEEVEVPTAVHHKHPAESSEPSASTLVNDKEATVCETNPQNFPNAEVPNMPLQDIPDSTEEDILSCSSSSSSHLSDDDITTSTPKKSKIPRLVKQSES